MPAKAVPFARKRIDSLLAQMYSVAAALLSIDVISNALQQRHLLDPVWFWITFTLLVGSQLGGLLGAFAFGNMRFWYRALTLSTLFTAFTWQLQAVNISALPVNFKPWLWWAIGFASIAAVGAFRTSIALIVLLAMPLVWLWVRTSPAGGGVELGAAIEDSLYSFFFSTSISLLVLVLHRRSEQVDAAHQAKIASVVQLATTRAIERERIRINSIAHDKVLSTLALAVHAEDDTQRRLAAESAVDAIGRLQRESERAPNSQEPVSTEVFAKALGEMISNVAPGFSYKTKMLHESQVAFDQLVAIAEATVQAAINSLQHASAANQRTVTLSNTASKLKVVIEDDGIGFRISNLARNNVGVNQAIMGRLKAFGVDVALNTKNGTTWVFEVKHNA